MRKHLFVLPLIRVIIDVKAKIVRPSPWLFTRPDGPR